MIAGLGGTTEAPTARPVTFGSTPRPVRIDSAIVTCTTLRDSDDQSRAHANGGDDRCRTPRRPSTVRSGRPRAGRERLRRAIAGAAAALVAAGTLAACGGGGSGGTPTLTWYINPDSGGQAEIAAALHRRGRRGVQDRDVGAAPDADGQREQLVRRLAAEDSSIDIMSLDVPFVPEFAQAGFLAPVPRRRVAGQRGRRPGRPGDGHLERQAGRGAVLGQGEHHA